MQQDYGFGAAFVEWFATDAGVAVDAGTNAGADAKDCTMKAPASWRRMSEQKRGHGHG